MIPSSINKIVNLFFVGGVMIVGTLLFWPEILDLEEGSASELVWISAGVPLAVFVGAIVDAVADLFRHYRGAPTHSRLAKLLLLGGELQAFMTVKEKVEQQLSARGCTGDQSILYEVAVGTFFDRSGSEAVAWSLRQFALALLFSDYIVVTLTFGVYALLMDNLAVLQRAGLFAAMMIASLLCMRASLRLYFVSYRGAYRGVLALLSGSDRLSVQNAGPDRSAPGTDSP